MSERRRARRALRPELGQHHLVDDAVVERFVAGIDLSGSEVVVDLGAGGGALTVPLARRAEALAVEVRADLVVETRRDPPVLPLGLAPGFRETLRPAWTRHHGASSARLRS